ncbi:MAG: DNA ligase [Firmicutes bacterium]|nr:DNA ligase [Bacillota bacterium]
MSVYDEKNLAPMLLKQSLPFDSENYIFELKLDGFRCLAYLNESTALKSRNNKDLTDNFFELKNLHQYVKVPCVLDGELIILKDGKPNFQELQNRTGLKKVKASNNATFVAFDILFLENEPLNNLPLYKRKKILQDNVTENNFLAYSRYIENNGKQLFESVKSKGLEGIVAKHKNGLYHFGKRTKDWLKIKVYKEKELLICGIFKNKNGYNLILAEFRNKVLIDSGTVGIVNGNTDLKKILEFCNKNKLDAPFFNNKDYKDAVWFKLKLTGIFQFTEKTGSGHLRHPVFKGLKAE